MTGRKLATARDKWLESEEGKRLRDGTASGQYLENRLVLAFYAGVAAAEKIAAEEAKAAAQEHRA